MTVDPAVWEAFFAESPDPCFAYEVGTSPRFTLCAVNPAWLEVTGIPGEAVGKSLEQLMPPEIVGFIAERLERCVAGRVHLSFDEELRFKNESRYWRTRLSPLVIGGEVRYIIGFGHDYTDFRNTAELERRLQQTQKLESLGVLAGGIAHDFNNLLTGILGHNSLIRMDPACTSELQEHAAHVETAATRAADLCRQMLAYSGRGRFAVRRLDLDELVRETTQLLKLSISKSTELKLELHTEGTPTEADPTQLQQVVMNLVLNASEACDGQQGLVTIKTGILSVTRQELGDAHLAPDLMDGRFLFLEVSDNGAGMTPQTQARIFDPFFTTKFTGRGLGLSAVLGIVRGHSGGIGVESQPGRGTVFRVLLPIAQGEAPRSIAPTAMNALHGEGCVLVVDDEEVVRTVAKHILESRGFSVCLAENGAEGVELYRTSSQPVIAVLMDLTMPKLDGVAAFQQLRQLDQHVPVILMSGYNEQDAVARFSGSGLAGFLQKPFTAEMLESKLGLALRGRS